MPSCLQQCTDRLFAWSLDKKAYSTKEGYSAFNALAGFAVAQGVALTAVAKGEGRTFLVLSIYFVAACLTICWTAKLLHSTREESDDEGASATVRAFDYPSIQHGRFTLAWILVVAGILMLLACLGLLPNQTMREYFSGDIKLSSSYFASRSTDRFAGIEGSRDDRQALDMWLKWIKSDEGDNNLVWLEQLTPFPAHQKSLNVELKYDSTLVDVSKRVAFLVKADRDSARPNLRQMQFDLDPPNFDQSNKLTLVEPDPGELLVIMCYVEARPKKSIKRLSDCSFAIARK
jgi:hypothetical protein